jgi:copper chaperone CopZ
VSAVIRQETITVSGIRCERCVMRLAKTLEGHEGLEAANANLMGQVTLAWDDEQTSRDEILQAMARGGFHELAPTGRQGPEARAAEPV